MAQLPEEEINRVMALGCVSFEPVHKVEEVLAGGTHDAH
jgi:hypothetical protein